MISRFQEKEIEKTFEQGKVAILYGARQVGKTTLAKCVAEKMKKSLYLTSDDPNVIAQLSSLTLAEYTMLFGDIELLVLDEAQRIENIGLILKLLYDNLPHLNILATGSSSFDLANKINEPLTGRKREIKLDPLSIQEVSASNFEVTGNIKTMLVRGGYPEVWQLSKSEAVQQLIEISNSYIYKDVFSPTVMYDQTILMNLMKLLAYQIGSEVSYHELSKTLGISSQTVKRYMDLLEKAFIIVRLNQYRKNQRVKVGRLRKVYFTDLGIRNAVINRFDEIEFRDDRGALWENFCIIERMKYLSRQGKIVSFYYWRNNRQQEIDLVEEEGEELRVFEMKYKENRRVKLPKDFTTQYPKYNRFDILTPENFLFKGLI